MQEHGADLTATNNEGQTAMSLAVGVGNKNGKFTFIDFKWLSFGSFRTASKPKLPRKLWANLLLDLWAVIQGGKKQQRKFSLPGLQQLAKLRASRLNLGGGGGRNFNDGVSLGPYMRKEVHRLLFSTIQHSLVVTPFSLCFQRVGRSKGKIKTNRVHENERKKHSRSFYDNNDKIENDCDLADWLNCALITRKDNAA